MKVSLLKKEYYFPFLLMFFFTIVALAQEKGIKTASFLDRKVIIIEEETINGKTELNRSEIDVPEGYTAICEEFTSSFLISKYISHSSSVASSGNV